MASHRPDPTGDQTDNLKIDHDGATLRALMAKLEQTKALIRDSRINDAIVILREVIENRGDHEPVLLELITQIGPYPRWATLARSLINEYITRYRDPGRYPWPLMSIIYFNSMIYGDYANAMAAKRGEIAKKNLFSLTDIHDLAWLAYYSGDRAEADRLIKGGRQIAGTLFTHFQSSLKGTQTPFIPVGITDTVARSFGDMCVMFDIYFKATTLGWMEKDNRFILYNDAIVCNKTLLQYCKEKVPTYTLSDLSGLLDQDGLYAAELCRENLQCLVVPELGGVVRDVAYPLLNEAWQDRALPPIFTLKDSHRADGYRALAGIGLGDGERWVGLHVRENGYHKDTSSGYNAYRSAAIEDYIPMIQHLTERGWWVVRLGDPSMTPLPSLPKVFDYALSDLKSDWMDVFLCAEAGFVVGTQSGVHNVATVFGTPVVLTNYLPYAGLPIGPNDAVVFQKLRSKRWGRLLTIRESFSPPFVSRSNKTFLDEQEIEVIPNSPEELSDVALLMLDQLDGRTLYNAEQQRHYQRFRIDTDYCGHQFRHPVGRCYLANVRDLLAQEGQ